MYKSPVYIVYLYERYFNVLVALCYKSDATFTRTQKDEQPLRVPNDDVST